MDAIQKKQLLLSLIPESGSSIGNGTLRERLRAEARKEGEELIDADYWPLRDSLIDDGLIETGRGKGGSVHRVVAPAPPPSADITTEPVAERILERSLYAPFLKAIEDGYVREHRIKRFVSEITATQGRRATGGKWTRPDIIIAAVRTYQFPPTKKLEVITFEVKPSLATAFEGVYEALAHSVFAHLSYLAVNVKEYKEADEIPDDRIVAECNRHGIGYITFEDPADYGTFEIIANGDDTQQPDPYEVDNFIRTQLSRENQDLLRELLQ
jgi:hypothetical protein